MPKFQFIEDGHKYLLEDDNKVIHTLPSVTQVLPYNYNSDFEFARQKGIYVHKTTELYNKDILDEDTLDPALIPYLDAYKLFLEQNTLEGIYDIKSGSPHPCTPLQLAGYALLAEEGLPADVCNLPAFEIKGYHKTYLFAGTIDILAEGKGVSALYLKDNGTYKLEDHSKELRKNKQIFLSFLTTWKFCHSHNLLNNRGIK